MNKNAQGKIIGIMIIISALVMIFLLSFILLKLSSSSTTGQTISSNQESDYIGETKCIPKTCSSIDAECGTWNDGCGNLIYCGSCDKGSICSDGRCAQTEEKIKKGCLIDGEETGEFCVSPSDCYELAYSMGVEDMSLISCLGGTNEIPVGYDLTRNVPSVVNAGNTFEVIYSTNREGKWGLSLIDSISGGCKFPNGDSELKTVMLSTEGLTKTITVTAPNSGRCTFSGDYKFGIEAIEKFPNVVVEIKEETPDESKEEIDFDISCGGRSYHNYSGCNDFYGQYNQGEDFWVYLWFVNKNSYDIICEVTEYYNNMRNDGWTKKYLPDTPDSTHIRIEYSPTNYRNVKYIAECYKSNDKSISSTKQVFFDVGWYY